MKKWKRIVVIILTLLMALSAVGMSIGAWYLLPYRSCRIDPEMLAEAGGKQKQSPRFYYYEYTDRQMQVGKLCAMESMEGAFPESTYVTYQQAPSALIAAFISIEDKRFYQHQGVDFLRTLEAGVHYLCHKGKSFGASTITQQLIKNLTGRDEYTTERKCAEIFEALDLERYVDKTEILEAYLNIINLANGCQGVGAAAKRYFGKQVEKLTVAECACLAAITNNPSYYDPIRHPENNWERRQVILDQMMQQGYITQSQYETARNEEIEVRALADSNGAAQNIRSWYVDMVLEDVISDLMAQYGYARSQAAGMVYGGGLSIYTAMDPKIQKIVADYYEDESHFPVGAEGRPQSSMIVMDPYTGDILGVAGAVGKKNGNQLQNYATDTLRPSGSTIKPLSVYGPALDQGAIHWASLLEDEPLQKEDLSDADAWEGGTRSSWPRNADGVYRGWMTAYSALIRSVNTVPIRLLAQMGREQAFDFLYRKLHMTHLCSQDKENGEDDLSYASLALGQHVRGVTVRELTAAYTICPQGVYRMPRSYYRVEDANGAVLLSNCSEGETVIKEKTASLMTQMLCGVTENGTAKASRFTSRTGIQCAGKTGTTQGNCDRWFVGYTPRLLAGVWMGYEYPAPMNGVQGNPCISIWDDVLEACERVYEGKKQTLRFDIHPELMYLSYCEASGDLPTLECIQAGKRKEGWFLPGSEPTHSCSSCGAS